MAFLRLEVLEQRELLSVKFHKNRSINNTDRKPKSLR
jgi:hypothetical protein